MTRRAIHTLKALAGVLLSVVGWLVVYFKISHWWALSTATDGIVGPAGLVGTEVVRIAPTLAYLFAIGLVFGHFMGASLGARWAALSAAAAMFAYALLSNQIFYGGLDPLAVLVLATNFLLPVLIAMAGAATSRLWHGSSSGRAAT